ncbi:MAG: excisionase [Burkholderiaceae bacterium]|nr:citrate synthase [Rhodoferax sp.]MCP5287307.1 excisionase [Burkholderiaceae bacterium]
MTLSTPRYSGELLSADQAAARLGVRKATLYAYVSRGLLTAVADPGHTRESRYPVWEVDRLRQGSRASRRAAPPLPGTLFDGLPLLDTALTGVVEGDIVVRGRSLVPWARQVSLEQAAAVLWNVRAEAAFSGPAPLLPEAWYRTAEGLQDADPASRAVALWGLAMPHLNGGVHLQGDELAAALGQHLRVFVGCWLAQAPDVAPLHLQVAHAWRVHEAGHDAVRLALVLCADVMTNLMGLSARMIASVQGSLAACLLASLTYGFARLSGGEFEAVEALFDELEDTGSLAQVAASYRARGETLPGIHHQLFPHGDPRAAALVQTAAELGSNAADWLANAADGSPLHPTLDFGLVALRRALKVPRQAPLMLAHLPRAAGTLAQALEQRAQGRRMWVQARYVGPVPARAVSR